MKVNIPRKDQRSEIGADGRPPEDGNQDCVPTALAAMAQALLGRPFTGDGFHDSAYGQGYLGLQNPARYVALMAANGLDMTYLDDAPARLVARAVAEINAGHPVLLAIPSDWGANPPRSQFAHMVAGCDTPDANTLVAMNPWGGFYQSQPLSWWQDRLARCSYQGIWIVKKGTPMTDTSGLGSGFAAFAQAHSLTCVSRDSAGRGEHTYAQDKGGASTFAAFAPTAEFPTGVILYYNQGTGEITPNKAPWVAAALWNRGEALRQQADQAESDLTAARQQITQLQAQVTQLHTQVTELQQQLGATGGADGNAAADQAIKALATALAAVKPS